MQNSTPMHATLGNVRQPVLYFAFSLAFLPLPIALGGSIFKEIFRLIQSIVASGWGAGDWFLALGMGAGAVLLVVTPLSCFVWGQVLAWANRKTDMASSLAVYAWMSIAYATIATVIIRSTFSS